MIQMVISMVIILHGDKHGEDCQLTVSNLDCRP
jgi:hypothetical protein